MQLNESDGKQWDFCWPSSKVCEHYRKRVVTEKMGTSTLCVAQKVAHCVGITHPISITWKSYCTRTAEQCEKNRELLLANPPAKGDEIDVCRPTRNINPHEAMEARTSMR